MADDPRDQELALLREWRPGKPVPSPGRTALAHVRIERDLRDGLPPIVTEYEAIWSGYTAEEATAERHRSLTDARTDVTRDSLTLVTRADRRGEDWDETTIIRFEDPS
jgi:hypothetical protein